MLIFIIYSSTSARVFQAFMCESFDDGSIYLKADYSIDWPLIQISKIWLEICEPESM